MTPKQMGEEVGCSYKTVCQWLRELGVQAARECRVCTEIKPIEEYENKTDRTCTECKSNPRTRRPPKDLGPIRLTDTAAVWATRAL